MQFRFVSLVLLAACPLFGQLSTEQRLVDFRNLASLYAKQYAPYEWKRDAQGFDLLRLDPWLERVRKAKDDLEFYEIMKEYVAALNDGHTAYFVPSTFVADLGFEADIYDGRILLDVIDRSMLPTRRYPFVEGDELISVDGVPAMDLAKSWMRFDSYGNERGTRRYFVDFLGYRDQSMIPRSSELGDTATIVVKRQSTGALESYQIPWSKSGRPLTIDGPVPTPIERAIPAATLSSAKGASSAKRRGAVAASVIARARAQKTAAVQDQTGPLVRKVFASQRVMSVPPGRMVKGIGTRAPFFQMPSSFVIRLGRSGSDAFYSGVYTANNLRIGYIRIPDFDPLIGTSSALRQFQTELTYFQRNTDGLVVDVMRNPGGDGCYAGDLLASLATKRIDIIGEEIRPTLFWVNLLDQAVSDYEYYGAEDWEIAQLKAIQKDVEQAFRENRGRTGSLGLCTGSLTEEPMVNSAGVPFGYTKPMLLLVDEYSSSAAEVFAAGFQDNGFGPLMGYRTSGLGGSRLTDTTSTGYYSEGNSLVTVSILTRPKEVNVPGVGPTRYFENVGVLPDIPYDVQTTDNLLNRGKPFLDAFTAAIADRIQKAAQP